VIGGSRDCQNGEEKEGKRRYYHTYAPSGGPLFHDSCGSCTLGNDGTASPCGFCSLPSLPSV